MDTFYLRQISSLEKVRLRDPQIEKELFSKKVFRGERFSYQVAVWDASDYLAELRVQVESPLQDYIKAYVVSNVPMDFPTYKGCTDEDYITKEPGLMPDLLVPLEERNGILDVYEGAACSVWIRLDLPADYPVGDYPITVRMEKISAEESTSNGPGPEERETHEKTMTVSVLPVALPEQKLIFTQWFHTDCIATAYDVEIFSEKHWELIDKYMQCAVETGINMLLMPVFTPPLDTMYGIYRPCVQLVDIVKNGDRYEFNFDKVRRWISLCKKNGIKYYETSHLFSQWGMKFTPNIMVEENGKKDYYFKWGVPSNSPEYEAFLGQLIPALFAVLRDEGIEQNTFFHISDEPGGTHVATYERISAMLKPLLGSSKRMDALSHYEFYERGLLDIPVASTNRIGPFLEHKIENQWAYYCCSQFNKVGNRFLAMPSYRNRILGLQLYKYNIKGFLQWGFNFYYSRCSMYPINPFLTTSADVSFPSGDPFTVYPGKRGPQFSLRAMVFYDALQDIAVCRLLEEKIGHDAVVAFIEQEAGMALEFDEYPRNADFLLNLREKMIDMIMSAK